MESEISDFDFKPLNEGLGFHRKVKPLESENESEDSFSFSAIGAGTLDVTSREQSKGLLSSATPSAGDGTSVPSFGLTGTQANGTTSGRAKHNTKSVSDLIAALPPSLDLLLDETSPGASAATTGAGVAVAASTSQAASSPSATTAGRKRAPLFGPPSDELAKPGAPAAASFSAASTSASAAAPEKKKGFLNLPLGRNDYGLKTKGGAPAAALDENVAKAFPTVFPHLGSLAGQPAAATLKGAATVAQTAAQTATVGTSTQQAAKALELETNSEEHAIAAHFGSAVLDTLVAIGMACLFLAVALSITGANLLALLENTQTDEATMVSLVLFFVGMALLYVLAARTWVGATLGEWSYEIRVGSARARRRWFYPIQILWRGALVAATGFVLMPLISLIAGRDVLKYLTGLELMSVEGASDSAQIAQVGHAAENPA